jgi:transposase
MKQVTLSQEEREALRQAHKSAPTHRERQRAHAILLSAKGYRLNQLADIFEADRDTISRWLDDWHEQSLAGLCDAPKAGRPRLLNDTAQDVIAQTLQTPTPKLKPLLQERLKKGALR